MSNNIVTEQEMMHSWEIGQRCKLIEFLNARGIPYDVTPKGKIWTVQEAINQTIIKHPSQTSESWNEEEFA